MRPPPLHRREPHTGSMELLSLPHGDSRIDRHVLQLAVDLGHIGVWRHDLATDRMHLSRRVYEILGLQPRDEGMSVREVRALVHPHDMHKVLESIKRALESSEPTDLEARYQRPDRTWRHVMMRRVVERDADGRAVAFIGVGLDVTDQVESSRRAADLTRGLELAVATAHMGIWSRTVNGPGTWNLEMFRIFGRDPALGVPGWDELFGSIVHPDDRRELAEQLSGVEPPVGAPLRTEHRIVRPSGEVRWISGRYTLDPSGARPVIHGVTLDITDAKNAEAARREREIALRESQAKSQFLARISHELRTPLNAVLGFTHLLQTEDDGDSPTRSMRLGQIRAAGEHLLALINEVLDLSSLESGQMRLELRPVSVPDVVREALALVQQAARQHDVRVEVGGVSGRVLADPTRLRQVLINLLTNAIKYNRPRGRVAVRSDVDGDRLLLSISDTGRGMRPDQLEHLFEPFNRLGIERDGIEGTGIGLVIVKALVERMAGAIAVRSQPETGTVFELRLPLHGASAGGTGSSSRLADNAAVPAASASTPLRTGCLLYIEDNPVNTLLVRELVAQRPGLTLTCAADGLSGVARAAEVGPDLILVDMQLPDIDGHEVLRRLRTHPATAGTPCIALSANAMTPDVEAALAAGFSDYWTKPIDIPAFLDALDRLFARQR
jgi:PAS domain S-box-containing protein